MATTTFKTACPDGEWTEIYDGTEAATIGMQVAVAPYDKAAVVQIYIGTGAPDEESPPDEDNWFYLNPYGGRDVSIDVASGDKIYAKGIGDAVVRGYKVVS